MVHRISFGASTRTFSLDHPSLTDGWWTPEHDDAAMWRWTDGDALLPVPPAVSMLEITVSGQDTYPVDKSRPRSRAAA